MVKKHALWQQPLCREYGHKTTRYRRAYKGLGQALIPGDLSCLSGEWGTDITGATVSRNIIRGRGCFISRE
ncbi:hypothetical protein EBL_c35110 [Shimwellia blattae DSM 4481 = NBRC 105725]|uniref:Uncharacterized protein n=1 Tax=Shimwellia blattae (strain ATCC 29907 / DSM 4481 / JCM 1650 / NBRC 105725 / CDC 9005-74) TaxID=630626 RepID=I2BDG2_SHIBC|nr:hypothetical protein EBL_c35110 [Shimwellia blattae DSM 4481 = NBRC 105725]